MTAERLQQQLARAITRLSPGERDVVLLVALSELSHEEVPEALGISGGTVRSRPSRARKKLRNLIDQEEVNASRKRRAMPIAVAVPTARRGRHRRRHLSQ